MLRPQKACGSSFERIGLGRKATPCVAFRFRESHASPSPTSSTVVVGGPAGGVVAQVGGEAGGHRDRAHGTSLPLKEEGPSIVATAQDPEGVGLDPVKPSAVLEVPRRPSGRVELQDLQRQIPSLAASAARKPWTASVWSMVRRSWRLLLPETLRQPRGGRKVRRLPTLVRCVAAPGGHASVKLPMQQ